MTERPLHVYFPSDVNAGSRSPCSHCGQSFDAHVGSVPASFTDEDVVTDEDVERVARALFRVRRGRDVFDPPDGTGDEWRIEETSARAALSAYLDT